MFKKDEVLSVIKVLTSYTSQITLSELKIKIEKLNDLNANDESQKADAINVLNDIVGQIRGNSRLRNECKDILDKLSYYAENKKVLTEPRKRSIISELRETLRHVDLYDLDQIIGGKK